MKQLSETYVNFKGQTIKRQKSVQLNGRRVAKQSWQKVDGRMELLYTGEVEVRPVGAFTFMGGTAIEQRSHLSAQATWTDQFFLRKTWEEAIAHMRNEGYEVETIIKDHYTYKEYKGI
jgi:hypothetical protein